MQQIRRPASAVIRRGADLLLDGLDAEKPLYVKGDDKVAAQKAVQLFRDKIGGIRFAGLDAVDDEIKIVLKPLDLRLAACLKALFDNER